MSACHVEEQKIPDVVFVDVEELNKARDQLETQKEANTGLEAEVARLARENASLEDQLARSRAVACLFESQVAELEKKYVELRAHLGAICGYAAKKLGAYPPLDK